MRKPLVAMILVIVGAVTGPGRLIAHHGNAAYDTATPITVRGTITEWIWANPHSFLKFDARDDSGKVAHWVGEASTPSDLVRNGVNKNSFKVGQDVTVTLVVAKNGLTVGRLRQVAITDGDAYQMGGGGGQPAAPTPPVAAPPAR